MIDQPLNVGVRDTTPMQSKIQAELLTFQKLNYSHALASMGDWFQYLHGCPSHLYKMAHNNAQAVLHIHGFPKMDGKYCFPSAVAWIPECKTHNTKGLLYIYWKKSTCKWTQAVHQTYFVQGSTV